MKFLFGNAIPLSYIRPKLSRRNGFGLWTLLARQVETFASLRNYGLDCFGSFPKYSATRIVTFMPLADVLGTIFE
ncbi:MAG: hypothetical protein IPH16_12405 [Haliscomenobacter sp.]|nr:hypothetical protein [Haliscomenobacter sp.]MBK7474508.1 hypothetical protein [Haliscomenobacter sp.]MBK8880621.1 hypothetical protein [Haliscomenobacter sp.]